MSVILNVAFVGLSTAAAAGFPPWAGTASLVALLVNTHFSDHVKIRFISQLINGMSSVLQKLLKCFNGVTFFVVSIPSNFAYNACFAIKRLWIFNGIIYIAIFTAYTAIWFISVAIPQPSLCFSIVFAKFKQIVHRHYNF